MRSGLALSVAVLLGACASSQPACGPLPAGFPAFDRDAERRAVLVAVLEQEYRAETARRFVIDETLAPDLMEAAVAAHLHAGLEADMVTLPDGDMVSPPDLAGLEKGTIHDWLAHARRVPAPRALTASLPIEWLSDADWSDWATFRRRYPGSSGWIRMSDVGFSPSGDQAVLQASLVWDDEAGYGHWILLQKQDGRWRIVDRQTMWIA